MNKSAAITFMRCNPPTTGHFLIVEEMHNLDVDNKFIYLSHSQDPKRNPLPYFEKYSFMKVFVAAKYKDVEVVNSPARTLVEALNEIYQEGFQDIYIVLGSDRIEEFSELILKYNGTLNKKTDEIIYKFDNINFVQAGQDRTEDQDSSNISSVSATKQRKLAAEGNFEEFSKGVPSSDPFLIEELYNTLRKYMGEETLEEGVFDKLSNKVSQFVHGDPVVKYYEVGPIIKGYWKEDLNEPLKFSSKEPWRYSVEWWPVDPKDYIDIHTYYKEDLDDKVLDIDVVDAEFRKIGKYNEVLYSTVKVTYRNEKAYQKYNNDIIKYLEAYTNPDDSYKSSNNLPTWKELEKEGFPKTKAIEIKK